MSYCPRCGGAIPVNIAACPFCGTPLTAVDTAIGQTERLSPSMTPQPPMSTPIYPAPPAWLSPTPITKPSALAVIGFILSVVCLVLSGLKLFALIGLIPTIALSVLGLLKSPATRRGLAVAALVLCSIALTLTLLFTALSFVQPNQFLESDTPDNGYYAFDPFDPFGSYFGDLFDDGYHYES